MAEHLPAWQSAAGVASALRAQIALYDPQGGGGEQFRKRKFCEIPPPWGAVVPAMQHAARQHKQAIAGVEKLVKKIKENLNKSLMLVTALAPEIGYEKSAEIAKKALKDNITLKESAKSLGYLSEQDFDNLVKPEEMVDPKKV